MKSDIFAERLRQTRQKNGLTQEELAKKSGVSKSTISLYENPDGEKGKNPSLDNAMRIAESLGVSLDWLCGLSDQPVSACAPGNQSFREIWNAILSLCKMQNVELFSVSPELVRIEVFDPIFSKLLHMLEKALAAFGGDVSADDCSAIFEIMSEYMERYEIVNGEVKERKNYV